MDSEQNSGNEPFTEPVQVQADQIPEPAPRFTQSEDRFFLVMAVFIGVISGAAVVCFRIAIEYSRTRLLGASFANPSSRMLLAPTIVGLVVAALVVLVFPAVRGSGVNQTKAALYIYDGYIPFRTAIGKFITSALAIGSGQSLGPEDPSLQIGAAIASVLGRKLRLSREKLRLVAPVGAAAGLAAAFNAPISAVLFVIEEVIGRWSAGILGAVVLSAISSVVVARWFLGAEPMFHIPAVEVTRPEELLAYAALGVVGGVASLVFAKGIDFFRPRLKALPKWTQFFQPALAGLLIGCIAYFGFPQVMGAGYNFMDLAMHDQFTWQVMGMLAGLKILTTIASFVSGTPGGMFAPTLFVGAMLGGAVGGVERILFPFHAGTVGTYALVGMGVMFAGFLRAPLTSVFMVLEVSGNYSIIVPVIVANTIAYVISRTFQRIPIFEALTKQDGLELPSMEEEREEVVVRIEDAMRPPSVAVVEFDELIVTSLHRIPKGSKFVFARDRQGNWAVLSATELMAAQELLGSAALVRDLVNNSVLPHLHPDHPLETAMKYLQRWEVLPVVHRADTSRILGMIELSDVVNGYRRAVEHELD